MYELIRDTSITHDAGKGNDDVDVDDWRSRAYEQKIVMGDRGKCLFEEKAAAVAVDGALGLIVVNNEVCTGNVFVYI